MKSFSIRKGSLVVIFSVIVLELFSQSFTEQTGIILPGIAKGNSVWGDADNDGDIDILIAGYDATNFTSVKVFRNNGSNSYTDAGNIFSPAIPAIFDAYGISASWVDFDNDGFVDIIINSPNNEGSNSILIYRHEADHSYLLKSTLKYWTWQSNSFDCGDYDNDGDIDILLATNSSIRIFQNNGNFSFLEQNTIVLDGLTNNSCKFGDYDNDGNLDILLIGFTGFSYSGTSRIYRNNGNNTFTLQSNTFIRGSFDGSVDWGDYNNDGFLDILITGKYSETEIYKNNGNNTFTNQSVGPILSVSDGSGKWGDIDNDGDLDIVLNGRNNNSNYTKIYINNGNNIFSELAGITIDGVYKSSVTLFDYDNDRDLDILISGDNGISKITKVFRNNSPVNNPVPAAPTGLTTETSGNNIILKWNPVTTDNTAAGSISYNVMVGTTAGGVNILSPNSAADGFHRISGSGNGQLGTSLVLRKIPKGVTLYWKVQAVDNSWKGGAFATGPNFTYASSIQASALNVPARDGGNATLSWSRGNGTNCVVFLKEANTGSALPSNGSTYTASSVFKTGTQIGTSGWYCVYNGFGGSVNVTNLKVKTDYIFQVIEYTGTIYDTSTSTENPSAFKTGSFSEIKTANLLPVTSFNWSSAPVNCYWLDIDNDAGNDLDLILQGPNTIKLYRNDGSNNFILLPATLATPNSSACGDFNNDGLIDIVIASYPNNALFRNTGGGTFAEQAGALPFASENATMDWGDYDNDGDLDLLIIGQSSTEGRTSRVFRNEGGGTFTDQLSITLTGVSYGDAKWTDYDNDGLLDLIISGYTSSSSQVTKIYRNSGKNSFTEQTGIVLEGASGTSIDWGDYNNDGFIDLIYTGASSTSIYRNNGNNSFSRQSAIALPAINSGSVKWGDYDNDGDLDILITGYTGAYKNQITKIFKNNSDNTFSEDQDAIFPGVGSGTASWGDYDKDGDLDIIIAGIAPGESISKIYRNDNTTINIVPAVPSGITSIVDKSDVTLKWKSVRSDNTPYKAMTYNVKAGTSSGAINIISPNSAVNGQRRIVSKGNALLDTTFLLKKMPFGTYYWSVQAVDNGFGGSAFSSEGSFTVSPVQARSLSAKIIDETSLLLKWDRGNGDRCVVFAKQTSSGGAVPVNNTGYVADPEFGFGSQIGTSGWYCVYNGRTDSVAVTGLLRSKQYSFHIIEYMGTFGSEQYFTVTADGNPGVFSTSLFTEQTGITLNSGWYNNVSWGDYDKDGFADILVPGIPSSRIYRNIGNNTFTEKTGIALPAVNYGCADWGDYDNDGDLDIIITGAMNNVPVANPVTKIYRNDGADVFTEQTSISLVQLLYSSVAWGDYDSDGDLDILLIGAYGTDPVYVPVSKIYENNGNNTFTEQTQIALTPLFKGSIRWIDYDNDGDLDIALTGAIENAIPGEGVTIIYRNNGNKTFTKQTTINLNGGSFSATSWGDFDNDGDLDVIFTSLGRMYLYQNTRENTFVEHMYVSLSWQGACYAAWGDYDNDGWLDIILTNPGLDTRIYRNTHGVLELGSLTPGFKKQDDEAVQNIGYSFVNWIDYDNDGDLDFLLSKESGLPTKIFKNNLIMKSGLFKTNTSPTAPTGLKAINSREGVSLSWKPVQNDETPSATMTYNVRVGKSKTNFNVTPSHSSATGFRKIAAIGNAQLDTSYLMKNMPAIKYYWSVQAVDQGLKGGSWSPIDSAVVKNVLAFFSADTVCHGLATTFTNQSVAFGETIQGYEWIFGDGATSTLTNPTHIFSTPGEKAVKLITYSATTRDTLTQQVLVKAKPIVDFSATIACYGKETVFDNLSDNPEMNITTWSWDYGDGKGSIAIEPGNHGYLVAGNYQVKLTAMADNVCSSFITKTVIVAEKPFAVISSNDNLTFCSDASVTLSVNTGTNFLYRWMRDDAAIPGANLPSHTDNRSGKYSVTVTNPIANNCDNTSSPVTLTSSPKPVDPQIITENYTGVNQCPGVTPITLKVDQSYTGYNYQWTRNGTPVSNATATSYTGLLAAGDYTVIATQEACKSESAVKTIAYAAAPEMPVVYVRGPVVWYMATSTKAYKEYKWYFNNQLIAGATKYIYVANKKLGTYRVEVANEQGGCLTSSKDIIIPTTKSGMTDFNIPAEYIVAGDNDAFTDVNIYPNPGNGLFFVEMDNQQRGDILISVYGYDGKGLFRIKSVKDSDFHKEIINLTGQPKGNYLIKIDLNGFSSVKKIILE